MKRILGVATLLILAAIPAAAQKIQIDHDAAVDFGSYSTFAWLPTDETSLAQVSPLMHSRVKNAIEDEFGKGGLQQVDDDPDVWVTYHTNAKDEVRFNTTSFGYGYGPGWRWGGGIGTSTTSAYTYTKGTLIVDVWDAATEQMIFRGSATATIPENPEKAAKQIDRSIEKMAKKSRKMRGVR